MKIDFSMLVKNLNALPHTPTPEPENVPPYVLTHILAPLRKDDCIHFADLDFEAFTEEDKKNYEFHSLFYIWRYLIGQSGRLPHKIAARQEAVP